MVVASNLAATRGHLNNFPAPKIRRINRRGHCRNTGGGPKASDTVGVEPEGKNGAIVSQYQAVGIARGHLRDLPAAQVSRVDLRGQRRIASNRTEPCLAICI